MSPAFSLEALKGPTYELRVYNPCEEEVEADYAGETYRIPAMSDVAVIPKGSHRLWDSNQTSAHGIGGWKLVPVTAEEVVRYMVGDDGRSGRLGARGIRLLDPRGDGNGINDKIRGEAREAWLRKQEDNDQAWVKAHEDTVRKALELGMKNPPEPDQKTLAAYRRLRERRAAGVSTEKPFRCTRCGLGVMTQADLDQHAEDFHGGPVEVKRGPGRPRKIQEEATV